MDWLSQSTNQHFVILHLRVHFQFNLNYYGVANLFELRYNFSLLNLYQKSSDHSLIMENQCLTPSLKAIILLLKVRERYALEIQAYF